MGEENVSRIMPTNHQRKRHSASFLSLFLPEPRCSVNSGKTTLSLSLSPFSEHAWRSVSEVFFAIMIF